MKVKWYSLILILVVISVVQLWGQGVSLQIANSIVPQSDLMLVQGTLYVKAAILSDAFNMVVYWDSKANTLMMRYGNVAFKFLVPSIRVWVNGKEIKIEHRTFMKKGRIYLPVRDIANLMGFDLKYVKSKKLVIMEEDKNYLLNIDVLSTLFHFRLVMNLSKSVEYKTFLLRAPDRVVIDVKNTVLTPPNYEQKLKTGPVREIKASQRTDGSVRFVFYTTDKITYKTLYDSDNRSLIIDIIRVIPNMYVEKKPTKIEVRPEKKIMIMLDPGHGGKDPGAIGTFGAKEKDEVLKMARLLKAKLEQFKNVKVLLTRNKDVYIPLMKRAEMANEAKAVVFVSIHMNYCRDPSVKGNEVYYFDFSTDSYARRVARRENMEPNGNKVKDAFHTAVAIFDKQITTIQSKKLAECIENYVKNDTDLKPRGVKKAELVVLAYTDMPAVLVETNFISNPQVVKELNNGKYLDELIDPIYMGVRDYLGLLKN